MTQDTKKKLSTPLIVGLGCGVLLILLIIIGVIANSGTSTTSTSPNTNNNATTTPRTETPTSTPTETETPKADTILLNATVKKSLDVPGIEITNNETVQWDECKFVLNSDYKRTLTNPLQPNDPLNNPYGLFTKSDGTRFDYNITAPKSVLIDCKVNGNSRQNVYMF